jgi:hypothetical protein
MVKGYEFEKGQFVLFTDEELKALAEESRQIDIVSFIPERSVDPLYYDKPYFLVPDKRGAKPYSLLLQAMKATGAARWPSGLGGQRSTWFRCEPSEGGLVLQQLLYADEVRSIADLHVDLVPVSEARARRWPNRSSSRSRLTRMTRGVRRRGKAAHPGGRRAQGRRQGDRHPRASRRGARQWPGARPDGGAACQPRRFAAQIRTSTTAIDRKPPQRAVSSSVAAKTNKKSARR